MKVDQRLIPIDDMIGLNTRGCSYLVSRKFSRYGGLDLAPENRKSLKAKQVFDFGN